MKKNLLKSFNWLSISENRKSGFYIFLLLILLMIYSFVLFGKLFSYNENVFNVLSLLIITYSLSDRLFSSPRDVIANSISVFVLALTIGLKVVWIYSLLVLIVGGLALIYEDEYKKGKKGISEKFGEVSYKLSQQMGKSKIIVSLLFFFTLRQYIIQDKNNIVIWSLFLYWLILLLPNIMDELFTMFHEQKEVNIGTIAYANSPYNAVVYLNYNSNIGVGDKVVFDSDCSDCQKNCSVKYYGVLNNIYTEKDKSSKLGNITFYGIDPNENCFREDYTNPLGLKEIKRPIENYSTFYKYKNDMNLPILSNSNKIIGHIYQGSNLDQIKFYIYPHMNVKRGDFVLVKFFSSKSQDFINVFYQIVNIFSYDDPDLDSIYGMNIAKANLVGKYEKNKFNKFKKLPYNSFPVWELETDDDTNDYDNYNEHIGYLPGTNHSIPLNINTSTVYHTAILGTTGSGKTTLSKELIKMLAENKIKTIILDVHGEYDLSLMDNIKIVEFEQFEIRESLESFVESEVYDNMEQKIEKGNDKTKQLLEDEKINSLVDLNLIISGLSSRSNDGKKTRTILKYFKDEWYPNDIFKDKKVKINSFVDSDNNILLLNLNNLNVDLQRWIAAKIAENIYDLYKNKKGETKLIDSDDSKEPKSKIALILEEAHIFVPENSNYDLGSNKSIKDKCYNYIANLALRGRKYGIGLYIISQRSAFVKKGVLSQCNTVFALKTISSNDKKVFYDFMEKEYVELLSNLEVPEAILVGKGSSSSKPLIINLDNDFEINTD